MFKNCFLIFPLFSLKKYKQKHTYGCIPFPLPFQKLLFSLPIPQTVYFDYFKVVDRTLPHSLSQLHSILFLWILYCLFNQSSTREYLNVSVSGFVNDAAIKWCVHKKKKKELWLRYTKHLLMTLCKKTYICNRQHSVVEETEVYTLSEKKKKQWNGVSSGIFWKTVFFQPTVWLRSSCSGESETLKKKIPFFPPIGKCLKWHKIGLQESAPSLRKTKSSQHQDSAKRGGQFVLLQGRLIFFTN